jgi:carbon-monoxide dehydrogenase medium subunit
VAVKEYFLPRSLGEAVDLLAEHGPSLQVIAGGTITMSLVNEGILFPEKVMGLRHAGLNYLKQTNGLVTLGATATLGQLTGLAAIPLLQEAARHTAGWSIRNMATIGGNIFAPPPAGDSAVALLALDARLKLVSPKGERMIPLVEFYTGLMTRAAQPDELLAEILVPIPSGQTAYLKYGRKQANTPAIVTVASYLVREGNRVKEVRIALNNVGPHPFRAKNAEAVLAGFQLDAETIAAAAAAAAEESAPFTDALASASYRRKMVSVFVRRALTQLMEQEGQ